MATIRPLIIALSIFAASFSYAAQTNCPEHYAGGQAPDFINQKLTTKAREVCYSGYGLMHSGKTRTPLYSAEHLTRERLQQAKAMRRQSKFFPDPNIPFYERAELRHYARSGYDRGHVILSAYTYKNVPSRPGGYRRNSFFCNGTNRYSRPLALIS